MFPGTFLTPAVLPPGMFGVLFEPAAVLGPLAALVAGVAAGLAIASALQARSKSGRRGTVHSLRAIRPAETVDRAAAA